jgi:hypothetical protein
MEKGEIPQNHKMLPQDQREFDRWLKANAIISSIFVAGLLAMALAGANSAGPRDSAVANNTKASDVAASEQRRGQTTALSPNDLRNRDKPFRP